MPPLQPPTPSRWAGMNDFFDELTGYGSESFRQQVKLRHDQFIHSTVLIGGAKAHSAQDPLQEGRAPEVIGAIRADAVM